MTATAFKRHAAFSTALGVLLVVVWTLTTRAYFWPVHALLPLAAILALHAWLVLLRKRHALRSRFGGSYGLAVHAGASGAQWLYLVALWIEGGGGYFWPAWALLGLGVLLGLHTLRVRSAPGV